MLIESFHSGRRGQRRYCSLHRPASRLTRSTGVVLCYPLGHEYFRSYRTYVRLADRLANLGYPVIRFDYLGTGDSDGETGHARIDGWLSDIANAIDELQRNERVSRIALCGMRYGATLAALAARETGMAGTLVLLEPVSDGRRYVEDMRQMHRRLLHDLERFPRPRATSDDDRHVEIIGTRYAQSLLQDIRKAPLDISAAHGVDNVVLAGQVSSSLKPRAAHCHVLELRADYGWNDARRIEESIVDPDLVEQAAAALNRVAA